MKKLLDRLQQLPPPLLRVVATLFSLLAGLAVALMFDYLLYRIGFPSKPFIYVSF